MHASARAVYPDRTSGAFPFSTRALLTREEPSRFERHLVKTFGTWGGVRDRDSLGWDHL